MMFGLLHSLFKQVKYSRIRVHPVPYTRKDNAPLPYHNSFLCIINHLTFYRECNVKHLRIGKDCCNKYK